MIIKNAGRKDVQGKLPIIVDDGVARIAPSLEADDDIRLLCQHIGDLAFSLVAPVGSYDCSNHC